MHSKIRIEQPGIYLFHAPVKVELAVQDEFVVVLASPKYQTCALSVQSRDTTSEMVIGLETLLKKLMDLRSVSHLQIKLFGKVLPQSLWAVRNWAHSKGLVITAEDFGRNTIRNLLVDCSSGKVGVTYADIHGRDSQMLMSEGTAKARLSKEPITLRVLILSTNRVSRHLAKQAVEERPYCQATTSAHPSKLIVNTHQRSFHWGLVLLFDDLEDDGSVETWMRSICGLNSQIHFCWIGNRKPDFYNTQVELHFILPPDPERIAQFKRDIGKMIDLPPSRTSHSSYVLPFRKTRRRY